MGLDILDLIPERRQDGKFRKRLRRHMYYAEMADFTTPSLPLTELAADYFHDCAPRKLGHVDLETASNIVRKNKVTPCAMVVSVLYAKRLRQRNKEYLETVSSSDIFFMSMMLASKYLYDEGTDAEVYNDEWAATIDQETEELNRMEMDYLQALDWKLFIHPEEFDMTLKAIEKRVAMGQGSWRGWFTYSELDVLLGPDLLLSLWTDVGSECSKLLMALSAGYVTSVLSLVASVLAASHLSAALTSATVAMVSMQSGLLPVSPVPHSPGLVESPDLVNLICRGSGHQCEDVNDTASMLEVDRQDEGVGNGLLVMLEEEGDDQDGNHGSVERSNDLELQAMSEMYEDGGHPQKLDLNEQGIEDKRPGEDDPRSLLSELKMKDQHAVLKGPAHFREGGTSPTLWSLWFIDSLLSQIWTVPLSRSPHEAAADVCPVSVCVGEGQRRCCSKAGRHQPKSNGSQGDETRAKDDNQAVGMNQHQGDSSNAEHTPCFQCSRPSTSSSIYKRSPHKIRHCCSSEPKALSCCKPSELSAGLGLVSSLLAWLGSKEGLGGEGRDNTDGTTYNNNHNCHSCRVCLSCCQTDMDRDTVAGCSQRYSQLSAHPAHKVHQCKACSNWETLVSADFHTCHQLYPEAKGSVLRTPGLFSTIYRTLQAT